MENIIEIKEIINDKEKYMDILLLGDEQESMIYKYLFRGHLYTLYDDDLKTVCLVTNESDTICEIKNLATYEKYQGNGYGHYMVKYIVDKYKNICKTLLVGTGEDEKTINFYKKCGFKYSHIIKDFFVNNYDHKIIENGNELKDMVYLKIDFD